MSTENTGDTYVVTPSASWIASHPGTPTTDAPAETPAPEADPVEHESAAPEAPDEGADSAGNPPEGGAPSPTDPYAAYGGEENVKQLLTIQEALRTESGIRAVAAQTLSRLGVPADLIPHILAGNISVAQAQAEGEARSDSPFAGIPGFEDYDEDATLSAGDALRLAQAIADQRVSGVEKTFEERQAAERQAAADDATLGTLSNLFGDDREKWDPALVDATVQFAQRYLDPNDWDPANIRQSLLQGHADVVKIRGDQQQKYLEEKREAKASVPKTSGGAGGAAGSEPAERPMNLKEASALARKRYPDLFK